MPRERAESSLPTLSNATRGLKRRAGSPTSPGSPCSPTGRCKRMAARTRVAVLERQARQADRCGPLPRDATMGPTLPSLLAMSQMACLNPSVPIAPMAANRNHCASQAVSSYHRQQERRSSRDMVDFVI
mmetsp:Transcript_29013/g.69067  ORF Transcript_29013/g.69067 Transcript_29013/m.69067 type:complete len:129 (-) Transcript_29013:253-639(-)